jgi:hypothetical protein
MVAGVGFEPVTFGFMSELNRSILRVAEVAGPGIGSQSNPGGFRHLPIGDRFFGNCVNSPTIAQWSSAECNTNRLQELAMTPLAHASEAEREASFADSRRISTQAASFETRTSSRADPRIAFAVGLLNPTN